MSETINIVIVDKKFETQALQGLVIRSEGNANTIKIQFPKTYENEDLTNKMFILKCTNPNGIYFENILQKNVKTDYIELTWVVEPIFTTVSGILKVAIFAESANYSLGTQMSKVIVEESPQITVPIDQYTVFEQYLKEIRVLADSTETYYEQTLAIKNNFESKIVDGLTSEDPKKILSANQGGVLNARINNIVGQAGISNTEIVDARNASLKNTVYPALKARLDASDSEIINLRKYLKIERYGVKISKSNSSPAGAMEYIYDAAGKQPAYMDFGNGKFNYGDWSDAFFIKQNRPVMLDASWNVVEELDKADQTKKTDGKPSSISNDASNLNAFAEFPQVWYKTWEDSTHQYFAVSNVQYDETYKCDVCKDAAGKIADKWYFPMFDGSLISGKMRSLADKAVNASTTAAQEIGYCTLNGTGWYTLDKEQIHVFVMLAELISKNRNSQQAFGDQVSLATNTAGINTGSLKTFGQFKGYNDGIHATKMFYCETGSLGYFMRYAGHVTNVDKAHLIKTCPPYNLTGEGYTNVGVVSGDSGSYIKDMKFTEDGIFANLTGGSATTFWPDVVSFNSNCYALWRGYWNYAANAGLRYVAVTYAASGAVSVIASALSGRKPVL